MSERIITLFIKDKTKTLELGVRHVPLEDVLSTRTVIFRKIKVWVVMIRFLSEKKRIALKLRLFLWWGRDEYSLLFHLGEKKVHDEMIIEDIISYGNVMI